MTGPRAKLRYMLVSRDGNSGRRCFCDVDADSTTLVLGGVRNFAATSVTAMDTYDFDIPAAGPRKKTNISARRVRVDYTGSLPSGRINPVVWVVVFRKATWDGYAIGQTGTHRGLPVICVAKSPGIPT